jgi:hypothetical protein
MIANPRGRMPGLCDYGRDFLTSPLVECAFGIDVRRWHRHKLLIPDTTFCCMWRTDDGKLASLKVRVESDTKVRLIYRVRMPGKRWQHLETPVRLAWDSCRYGGRRPWILCPTLRSEWGTTLFWGRPSFHVLLPVMCRPQVRKPIERPTPTPDAKSAENPTSIGRERLTAGAISRQTSCHAMEEVRPS